MMTVPQLLVLGLFLAVAAPPHISTGQTKAESSGPPEAQGAALAVTGPAHGALVLVGGGATQADVTRRFVELGGGVSAHLVVVASALPADMLTPEGISRLTTRGSQIFGVADVTILHAHDRAEADSEAFVKPLERATAVWTLGGDENQLAKLYVGTRSEREIKAVAGRGGVLGGTSAGAMILAQFISDVTANSPEQYAHPLTGFKIFTNTIVVPHWSQRGHQMRIPALLAPHPGLLIVAVDEATAAVVKGSRLEVVGDGHVGIYDGQTHDGRPYQLLSPGQALDLKTITIH
jgi:cyanophycinase